MDKEPKKSNDQLQENDVEEIRITSVPLMVLIAGALSSTDFISWMFTIAEMLVVFVLTYQILGRVLFTALIVTPILVVFISRCMQCYDEIMYGDEDDMDDDDENSHFGNHWNQNLK